MGSEHYSAAYSPEDDKLRISGPRFDAEEYARVHGAGFRWAPKQDLWFATGSPPGRLSERTWRWNSLARSGTRTQASLTGLRRAPAGHRLVWIFAPEIVQD